MRSIALIAFVIFLATSLMIFIKGTLNPKFEFWASPNGLDNPIVTAKLALRGKYGEDWDKEYLILGITTKHPAISLDHIFIRVDPPDFCILVTAKGAYFLPPEKFNKFLKTYGSNVDLEDIQDIAHLFQIYLKLYSGLAASGGEPLGGETYYENIFTEEHLRRFEEWANMVKEKHGINPEKFTRLDVKKENSHHLLDCYTIIYPAVPSPIYVTISHYFVKIGGKGEIYPTLISKKAM